MRILIVEDEEDYANSLSLGLKSEGYAVNIAIDGESALHLFELYPFDLVLLDLNLPDVDGIHLCETMRQTNQQVLICIISARIDVSDRIEGLDIGADTYLPKPIHFEEVLANIRALTRRNANLRRPVIDLGDMSIDTNQKTVFIGQNNINLTAKEYYLLLHFAQNVGRVISSEDLILHSWGEEDALFSNTLRAHISNLRKKMLEAGVNNPWIETRINQGYVLQLDDKSNS